jgi:hypothetical protein
MEDHAMSKTIIVSILVVPFLLACKPAAEGGKPPIAAAPQTEVEKAPPTVKEPPAPPMPSTNESALPKDESKDKGADTTTK